MPLGEPLIPIHTIKYKTYVKEALVEAFRAVFAAHPDDILRKTKVGIDFPTTESMYPAIVVRFYERSITNAGIGHFEMLDDPENPGRYLRYKHYLYQGDIEFAVYALSSYDRDLISDSIVQTLAMGDLEPYSDQFLDRIYNSDPAVEPASLDHFINLNTDTIQGFGETQALAPWQPEDLLVYQTSYRIGIHGEFYSRTPPVVNYGLVEKVESYPYMPADGETKPSPNPEDPAPWEG